MMSDYEQIARAVTFMEGHTPPRLSLDEVAAHLHLSPKRFRHLFQRWAGVMPGAFLPLLTPDRARQLLHKVTPLAATPVPAGVGNRALPHEQRLRLEVLSPGEARAKSSGLLIEYGVHETPYGKAFIAATPRGICNLAFPDLSAVQEYLLEQSGKWPQAVWQENPHSTGRLIRAVFDSDTPLHRPLSLSVSGTCFQGSVWLALLQIPSGQVVSYRQVAEAIGCPAAARAVGTAIGANPVAFLIPCHRVVRQGGNLGGFRWGAVRKQLMYVREAAKVG